jgi:hypothetical protein
MTEACRERFDEFVETRPKVESREDSKLCLCTNVSNYLVFLASNIFPTLKIVTGGF